MCKNERGMSLAEVLVSLAIVSTLVVFSLRMVTTAHRATQDNVHRQFAVQKAMSILEEMKALIQSEGGANATVLDDYDDGVTNQKVLTIQPKIKDPGNPASGNTSLGGGKWLYERRISVQKLTGRRDLRLVNVKIYVNEASGQRLLAEVAGVLSTPAQNAPPTQVYDVYCLAIENVPGWWLYMQNVVPYVENAIQDLESRHPGLQFRTHWIRKLSYGRDQTYTPYVNEAADSTAPINSVYFYPGKMPEGSAVDFYYPPDYFGARVKIDGAVRNDFHAEDNPLPYALADQYNHAMRYEDELALFNARVTAKLEVADTPTLRLLLDGMYLNPEKYLNAIVINLHGELFPFPPVRNYSDPAKDPATYPWIRAVTHPEKLRYGNGDAVNLRVYAYHTRPSSPGTIPEWLGRGGSATPITVLLKGVNWMVPPGAITAITGGVDFDNNGAPDRYQVINPASDTTAGTSAPTGMWFSSEIVGTDTVIRLYNTPLKTPCVTNSSTCDRGGLTAGKRLYNLEYIPAPVENVPDALSPLPFATTLASTGDVVKNTARWVISIPADRLPANSVLRFETRIGNDLTTGTVWPLPGNAPPNLSRTYTWRGDDIWIFGNAANSPHMPITERFQILGDPRHSPYADAKMPHQGSGLARQNQLGMGYNRYFDDFHAPGGGNNKAADWPGYSYETGAPGSGNWHGIKNNVNDTTNSNDGWDSRSGQLEIDVPRIFQIFRSALLRPSTVYTTMTGFSYYYVGLGNEIGYDSANGFADSIPVSNQPFGGNGTRNEQSITDASPGGFAGGVKYIREMSAAADYWWGLNWLGELYPDSAYTGANGWAATGNLPAGNGAGLFARTLRGSITSNLPAGTALRNTVRRPQEEGSTTFFWSGSTTSTFHHRYEDGTNAARSAAGDDIAKTFQIPLAESMPNSRPFDIDIDDTGMNPDHFLQAVYGAPNKLARLSLYYQHSTNVDGSSALTMSDPAGNTMFVVVNGLSPTGESGVSFISRWSFLSLVQTFLAAGRNGAPDMNAPRVKELPRIVITSPNDDTELNDPSSIDVKWDVQWKRWDGLPYTPEYPDTYAETVPLSFATLYSPDNGRSWKHMKDDSEATPGTKPAAGYLTSSTSKLWNIPSTNFPKGNYVIRIEAYREGLPLHYSFHQYRAYVKR